MSEYTRVPPPKTQDMFLDVIVDDAVAEHFPAGSKLLSARPHGSCASFWTRTARIDLELPDKTQRRYFMKVATGDVGLGMLRGEYFGVKELHRFVPEGIPHPVAWGTYRADPNTHFYLCDFIDMIEELPDIRRFCSMLAKLHHNSMVSDDAPTEFGFPTVTYEGNLYQDVTWCKTWEDSFKRLLQAFVDQEKISHGPSEELDELLPPFMEKVIPRLLRPLQTHGRNVKPALIHGDIWYGNMGTNADTGEPIMINPSVFWGHNECVVELMSVSHIDDLDNMNVLRYRLGRHWMREYHKNFPISAPEDDYEDRNTVYAIRGHFCISAICQDITSFRRMAIDEMRRLVEKYPNGYQGE